jgi:asparagine synthase (glutamine-hydrolysing)
MCGILGGINIEEAALQAALPLLHHRGPDEHGSIRYENTGLLHTRLSILDREGGQQPFIYNNLSVILNGEIYNHLDLRKQYNLKCRTRSDVETLIVLYERFGTDILNELEGMFAFAIFDRKSRILLLVRDRAGKKPLYYYGDETRFAFASELNTLRTLGNFRINYQKIFQYLCFSLSGSATPYEGIQELPAGSFLKVDTTSLQYKISRWWSIEDKYYSDGKRSLSENIEILRSLLDKSVSDRLHNSDLEVGALLSGGIDSGLIVAFASNHVQSLKTFTISIDGQYDEAPLAEMVSLKYGTSHTTMRISYNELQQEIENILAAFGEPFGDSSAIPAYLISREAKKYVTVLLNGDGADELFGGYRRYVPFASYDFFKSRRLKRSLFKIISAALPFPERKNSNYNYLYRLANLASKTPLECYLSSTVDSFTGFEKYLKYREHPFMEMESYLEHLNITELSGLRKIMLLDFVYQLPDDFLVKMDIITMANSLEGRSPFLSKHMLEFAPSVEDNQKIRGTTTKYILREMAKNYLPGCIPAQPKRGFEVPLRKWIEQDLREMVADYLSGCPFVSEFIEEDFINALLANKAPVPPEKRAKMLWYMLALEVWYRKCYLKQ